MTREEAVKAIECNRPTSGYQMLREALDMAVDALREQEERGRGCEYCNEGGEGYRKMHRTFFYHKPIPWQCVEP